MNPNMADEICAVYGFTREQVFNCLGLSYIETERQLAEDYEATRQRALTCGCDCGRRRDEHLCPCGCGHNYDEAVRNIMGGTMALNWYQASGNIDENPQIPCKW